MTLSYEQDIKPQLGSLKISSILAKNAVVTAFDNGIVLFYKNAPIALLLLKDEKIGRYVIAPLWDSCSSALQETAEFFNLNNCGYLKKLIKCKKIKIIHSDICEFGEPND